MIQEDVPMTSIVAVLKSKIGRRVAPVVFVALAGLTLAACGSSGASGGSGGQHSTPTTKPASGGGAGF
jgi:hypothetical protein